MDRIGAKSAEIEALYRQHGAALLLFATAIVGERSRGQDLVQQVFLRLLQDDALSRANEVKAYLFGCVRNAALNERRSDARQAPLEADSAWFSPPDRDYAGEQNLRRALGTLPDDQRQVVILHVWGELTFSQIATLLEVSSNTAASRYRYALAKLRDSMLAKEDCCAEPQ
jgi:RNA polymerase sigma-70 factor (ECF subfamily)